MTDEATSGPVMKVRPFERIVEDIPARYSARKVSTRSRSRSSTESRSEHTQASFAGSHSEAVCRPFSSAPPALVFTSIRRGPAGVTWKS